MIEVWDLEVDFDMTTKSSVMSVGLYSTKEVAERARDNLQLESWQWSTISKRLVISNVD